MSGRFRLDPRAAEPPRSFEPPPLAPQAPARLPPAPGPPARVAAGPAQAKRRWLLIGGVAAVVLLLGGAVAIYVATAAGYPDAYVLSRGEYPQGVSLARLSAGDREELGIAENPGEMDPADLDFARDTPAERGYMQVLQTGNGGRIVVMALQYATEEDAKGAALDARALCSFANGVALRDGRVVVAVLPEDGASRSSVLAVGRALVDKKDGLKAVCGGL